MNRQQHYSDTVRAAYPQLAIHQAELREGGQYNDLLIVNRSIIFRFPRYAEAAASLTLEAAILNAIHDHLPLQTPNPMYVRFGSQRLHENFVGYPMISGETVNIYSLTRDYDDAICQHLADQLGDFLKALHSFPAAQLSPQIGMSDDLAYWSDMYDRIRTKLFSLMSAAGRKQVADHFETYLADSRNFDYPIVLRHGDFGTGNILFDRANTKFTGVIDFGSAALGDAAVDLSAIYGWRGRGEALALRMFKRYPELETMLARAKFYAGTFLLQEALFGAENNEPELIQSGLEPYV